MKAYELLDSPEKWIKGTYAKTGPQGQQCGPWQDFAKCWCVAGALWHCYGDYDGQRKKLLAIIKKSGNPIGLSEWNDAEERTYEEVIALLKDADV